MKQIIVFFLLFMFSLFQNAFGQKNQLLWEVSIKGKKEKSYIYGSFHSNDKRVFKLSDTVYYALNQAKTIVLETDIFSMFKDMDTRVQDFKILYDNQGNPYTGSNKASTTSYGNEDGMPQFLDAFFQEYAYNSNKKFFPLEKVEEQLNLLKGYNLDRYSNIDFQSLVVSQENMIQVYLNGDIEKLDQLMKVNLSIYKGLYDKMIVNRNILMANHLDSLLRKETIFCAVGAGHLAGQKGIIELLKAKGYRLRVVNQSFSEVPTVAKQEVKSKNQYIYENDTLGLIINFAGKPVETKTFDGNLKLIYREFGQGNTYSVEIVPIDPEFSFKEQAELYIASPNEAKVKRIILDDDSEIYEGISDTYLEGLHWVRVMQNDQYLFIIKASGGNKFMNSNRPKTFFSKVYLD